MRSLEAILKELATEVFRDLGGVGIDVVDVTLMRDLLVDGGQHFVDAYWTAAEQADCHNAFERIAGRWAAKEAVMKTLGAGVGDLDPIDIEILTLASGAPRVVLRGRAAEIADELNLEECHVSITHEAGWAAAIAVAQRRMNSLPSNRSPDEPGTAGGARA